MPPWDVLRCCYLHSPPLAFSEGVCVLDPRSCGYMSTISYLFLFLGRRSVPISRSALQRGWNGYDNVKTKSVPLGWVVGLHFASGSGRSAWQTEYRFDGRASAVSTFAAVAVALESGVPFQSADRPLNAGGTDLATWRPNPFRSDG